MSLNSLSDCDWMWLNEFEWVWNEWKWSNFDEILDGVKRRWNSGNLIGVKKGEKVVFLDGVRKCQNVKMSKCQNVKKSNLSGKVGKVAFWRFRVFRRFSMFLVILVILGIWMKMMKFYEFENLWVSLSLIEFESLSEWDRI